MINTDKIFMIKREPMKSHHSVSLYRFFKGFSTVDSNRPFSRFQLRLGDDQPGKWETVGPSLLCSPKHGSMSWMFFSVGQWSITSQSNEKLHKVYHVFRQLASDVFHIKLMEMNSKLCSRYWRIAITKCSMHGRLTWRCPHCGFFFANVGNSWQFCNHG